MCGRFTLVDLSQFTDLFPWIRPPDQPAPARYNIAPSQPVAVVINDPQPKIEFFQWGLVPHWAKDPSIGNRMINARAESLARKNAFRIPLKRRRCLIPASGFFEWRKNPDRSRTPMYLTRRDGRPMCFGGLWDVWHSPAGGELRTCTIITTDANELAASVHDRMPLILEESAWQRWLAPGEVEPRELEPLLAPFPAEAMRMHPVSRIVNSPGTDAPECIRPVDEPGAGGAEQRGLFD
jgi:putative SOS response-associated peptidase YedK